ncbi:unnamed protein product [Didymodactylos carnosus]|nr:unnamed protein product [Didymodactylos carnosus]CAF3965462.1 unnamed protein product [Didymodactylos carnosus]
MGSSGPNIVALNSSKVSPNMQTFDENKTFHHIWWKIALIILAFISFIITCVFNGLASTAPNGIFSQRTGNVSDNNRTEFTPAGWTFSIWGLIYFWQAAWLLYAISRILRKSNIDYLYKYPNTLHYTIFIFYIINMSLNCLWLVLWDRLEFGWALLVIFLMFVTIAIPMIITHILLEKNRNAYIESRQIIDIWLIRLLVHNGLAIYATWLFLAMNLNLTIWIKAMGKNATDAATAALSVVLLGIIIYFVCENIIFYNSMAYTWIPWFVLIFALSGIMSLNYKTPRNPTRNQSYVLALLIICDVNVPQEWQVDNVGNQFLRFTSPMSNKILVFVTDRGLNELASCDHWNVEDINCMKGG